MRRTDHWGEFPVCDISRYHSAFREIVDEIGKDPPLLNARVRTEKVIGGDKRPMEGKNEKTVRSRGTWHKEMDFRGCQNGG